MVSTAVKWTPHFLSKILQKGPQLNKRRGTYSNIRDNSIWYGRYRWLAHQIIDTDGQDLENWYWEWISLITTIQFFFIVWLLSQESVWLKFSREGAGVGTFSKPPPSTNNFCLYPPPVLRCFWKDSLITPHHPTSSIFHSYPLPIHHRSPLKILIIHELIRHLYWHIHMAKKLSVLWPQKWKHSQFLLSFSMK